MVRIGGSGPTGDIGRTRPTVNVTTSGDDDAANHDGGPGTNHSDGRDRRDGPTHAHAHAHGRL